MSERLRVLRRSNFRNLWLATTTSAMGDNIVVVALALFVTDLTGNPVDVGIVLGAQLIPLVAFLLIGGVWADRLPRARVMLATDIVRAALHTLLAILIFTDSVEIWHLVVIEALFGTAEAFFRPAHTGLVPRTVPEEEIQEAQALSNLTFNLAELIGPALATLLVLGLGAGWAFLLDAATFVVSAFFLARVRSSEAPPAYEERNTLLAELAEGYREVRTRSWMWVTVVVFALAIPLGYAPLYVLGPTLAEDGYDSAAVFGLVTAGFGAGALLGAIAGLRWRPRFPLRTALLMVLVWPLMIVSFALVAPVALVLALAVATGAGFALFDVFWDTAVAEQIPPHALSRASAYEWMGSLILLPVGYLAAGPLAEATSIETVLVAGAALTAVVLALGLLPRETRMLRGIQHEPLQTDGSQV
jgi:MFS family permease